MISMVHQQIIITIIIIQHQTSIKVMDKDKIINK